MRGHQQSKKIRRNIRAPFDVIDGFGLPSGAIKKQIYNDHNKDNPNPRLKCN